VESGGGFAAWMLKGKRVGFTKLQKPKIGGSWGEYIVTDAMQCVALGNDVTFEQGACSFVNPLTAIGFLDKAQEYGAKAVIQTAAASQLGRMVIKLFKEAGISVINVVRKQEQVDLLKNEHGAEYVLNSSEENFDKDLYELSTKLSATVAFECVAGDMVGRVLQVLGRGGVLIQYGELSGQKMGGVNPVVMIFKHQRIEAFLLNNWLATKSLWTKWSAVNKTQTLVGGVTVQKSFGLHEVKEAIEFYQANMTNGKIFLKPSLTE